VLRRDEKPGFSIYQQKRGDHVPAGASDEYEGGAELCDF